MKLGNSASLTRIYNRSVVLDALRRNESLSRIELARLSGLTPQAIRVIVGDLMEEGLVQQLGRRKGLPGQPQIEITINPNGGYALGFHIVDNWCHYLATNLAGEVIVDGGTIDLPENPSALKPHLDRIDRQAARAAGKSPRVGVGIAVSNLMAAGGLIEPHPENRAYTEHIQRHFGPDTFVENDANAAAMAETMFGRAKSREDFIYLFIGDGVGGAIVRGGELQRGHRGNAGEFGHIVVDPAGRICHCGNRGCLYTYLSTAALKTKTKQTAARDKSVREWLSKAIPALRSAVVSLENSFDPERLIVGGTAPVELLKTLVAELNPLGPSIRSDAPERVEVSELGPTTALLGAAALPLLSLMSPSAAKLTKQSLSAATSGAGEPSC
ncbi:putative Transcriptional regulator protein [Mesorhizobium plurifarium]|uniref:Putative Transcriptional regulator protein n=1 Tax=Mesorhizobium plurifarium TaxID=69974 RepID=A0A090DBB9_MESPL|nr:putative Transcriptional regulator protein [Mesorhizobium plurifarium]